MQAKKIFLLLISFSILGITYSQSIIDSSLIRHQNEVYVSFIGEASIISINYENKFINYKNAFVGAKIGIGYNESFEICINGPCNSKHKQFVTVPHEITLNLGSQKNYFEFGLGSTLVINDSTNDYLPFFIVGYRYQPRVKNKLMFKVFANIRLTSENTNERYWVIPIGISLGYGF